MRYDGTAYITERQCLRGGMSSGGGAVELKMCCLVRSSLQKETSIRVIPGSAVWHEGTQIILAMLSVSALAKTAACRHHLNFYLHCIPEYINISLFSPCLLQLRSVITTPGSTLKVTAPNFSSFLNTRRS